MSNNSSTEESVESTESTVTPSPAPTSSSTSLEKAASPHADNSELFTEHGHTAIADVVVSKIAGMAAREVTGVHALGGGTARAIGALRERVPGGRVNIQQGISVEVGERQAAVDISIVAEYGVAIHELAEVIRRNIILSIERMTGLEVTEVNVTVHDVHLPDDSEDSNSSTEKSIPRVQ